jgi:GNAT superfamily N-acetyltransferase
MGFRHGKPGGVVLFRQTWLRECGEDYQAMIGLRDEDIRAIVAETLAATLSDLHRLTFLKSAPMPAFDWGHWWLAFHEGAPIAFAGQVQSAYAENAGYFCRVGVLQEQWGRALQLRLMRAAEARARINGWALVISDTTDNVPWAIGYRPRCPFGWPHTLYWRKSIGRDSHN